MKIVSSPTQLTIFPQKEPSKSIQYEDLWTLRAMVRKIKSLPMMGIEKIEPGSSPTVHGVQRRRKHLKETAAKIQSCLNWLRIEQQQGNSLGFPSRCVRA
jgi:hypothetical protein